MQGDKLGGAEIRGTFGSRLGCRCIEQVWNDVRLERDWWCVSVSGGTREKARSEVEWYLLLLLFKHVEEIKFPGRLRLLACGGLESSESEAFNNLLGDCYFRTLSSFSGLEALRAVLMALHMIDNVRGLQKSVATSFSTTNTEFSFRHNIFRGIWMLLSAVIQQIFLPKISTPTSTATSRNIARKRALVMLVAHMLSVR